MIQSLQLPTTFYDREVLYFTVLRFTPLPSSLLYNSYPQRFPTVINYLGKRGNEQACTLWTLSTVKVETTGSQQVWEGGKSHITEWGFILLDQSSRVQANRCKSLFCFRDQGGTSYNSSKRTEGIREWPVAMQSMYGSTKSKPRLSARLCTWS